MPHSLTIKWTEWWQSHIQKYINMLIKGIANCFSSWAAFGLLEWYLLWQWSTIHHKPHSRPLFKLPPAGFTSLLGIVPLLSCDVYACLHQQVLCSRAEDYNSRGVLCDARQEGPLRRNPGNHNRNVVERLPTSAEVEFTLRLTNYDTGAMDRSSNMSFRNMVEGQISSAMNTHTLLTILHYILLCPVSFHSYCVTVSCAVDWNDNYNNNFIFM